MKNQTTMSNRLAQAAMMGGYGTFLNEIYIDDWDFIIDIVNGYINWFQKRYHNETLLLHSNDGRIWYFSK